MLNLALCSDNVTQLEHLAGLLAAYGEAHPEPALKVRRFHSLYDLLDRLAAGCSFSLCLLDHSHQSWMGNLTPEALLRKFFPDGAIVGFTTLPSAAFPQPIPSDPLRLAASASRWTITFSFRPWSSLSRGSRPPPLPRRRTGRCCFSPPRRGRGSCPFPPWSTSPMTTILSPA